MFDMKEGQLYKVRLAPEYAEVMMLEGEPYEVQRVGEKLTLKPFGKKVDANQTPKEITINELFNYPF